jgi:hypothetical protein
VLLDHQMFPAPGVYEGETTPAEAIIVVQLMIPSKFAVAAWTLSTGAVMSHEAFAWTNTRPAMSIFT